MLTLNGTEVILDNFPDGTLLMKSDTLSNQLNITWSYENDAELFALICLAKHLRYNNPGADIYLTMLYIPNARMDRTKGIGDVFTLKYFAEIINSLEFTKVTVLDPHSAVSEALIDRIDIVSAERYIHLVIEDINAREAEPPTIYFTDEGGQKRYGHMLKQPTVYGMKKRNWEDGQILGIELFGEESHVRDKNVLVIDDIISYGGSIYYSAMKLKELDCRRIYVYASHVENSILDKDKGKLINSGLIERIYTTRSLYRGSHPLIQVIE